MAKSKGASPILFGLLTFGIPTLIVLGLLAWQATFLNWLIVAFLSAPLIWIAGIMVIGGGLFAFITFESRDHARLFMPMTGLIVVGLIGGVYLIATQGYRVSQNYYASVEVVEANDGKPDIPEYDVRAPLTVAREQTSGNVSINGSAEDTTFIPNENRYGAVVVKAGWNSGYGAVVYQEIGDNGQAKVDNCEFDASAKDHLGGWFNRNLGRQIVHTAGFSTFWDEEDTYAYCDGDTPYFVVPLQQKSGFFSPINVPAGVAIYNGETDELEIKDELAVGEIPGPVYPLSLSEKARDSSRASGSWWDYVQSKVGYQDTSAADSNDPNAGNAGEFTLAQTDSDESDYVTQLVPLGRGNAITAIGRVNANSVTAGELNPYYMAVMDPRQSNSAVEDRIRADYGTLEWAAGMEVFEIAPTGPNAWVATLGRSKSVMYRLQINPDSSSCLFNVKGEKIRCSTDEGSSEETDPNTSTPEDMSTLTDKELAELNRLVQEEINKRLEDE